MVHRNAVFTHVLGLAALPVCLTPYFHLRAADLKPSQDFVSVRVGQCKEQANTTAPDVECRADEDACQPSTVSKTFSLGVDANGGIITVSGGVSYTYDVPTGCASPNEISRQGCQASTGAIQWTDAGGPQVAGDQVKCMQFLDNCPCAPSQSNVTITLPANIVQQLAGADGNTFTFPATICASVLGDCNKNTCPGTNGGQTWYYVPRQTLCNQ